MKKPAGQPGYTTVIIESANRNGTYDVRLSSGKKEFNIRPAQLVATPSSIGNEDVDSRSASPGLR